MRSWRQERIFYHSNDMEDSIDRVHIFFDPLFNYLRQCFGLLFRCNDIRAETSSWQFLAWPRLLFCRRTHVEYTLKRRSKVEFSFSIELRNSCIWPSMKKALAAANTLSSDPCSGEARPKAFTVASTGLRTDLHCSRHASGDCRCLESIMATKSSKIRLFLIFRD